MKDPKPEYSKADEAKKNRIKSWNYRVVQETIDGGVSFFIIEAYYNPRGKIVAWHMDVSPVGETVEELKKEVQHMYDAFERVIVKKEKLPDASEVDPKPYL